MMNFIEAHADTLGTVAATLASLLVAFLPSIITGASQYPKIQGALRLLLARLSILQPKDSAGTFKAPLKKPKPAPIAVDVEGPTQPMIVTKMPSFLLPFLFIGLFFSSCCKGPECKGGIIDTAIDCTKDVVRSRGPQLFPIVADLLAFGSDWKAELHALAANIGAYGAETVYCVVNRVLESNSKMAAGPGAATMSAHDSMKMRTILERAPQYLEGKELKTE